MGPNGADAAAAVPQEAQAQVRTLLRFFLKQELGELSKTTQNNDNNKTTPTPNFRSQSSRGRLIAPELESYRYSPVFKNGEALFANA